METETRPSTENSCPPKKPNPIRRLYNWVLHWAETPYGGRALFLISFAESSVFPLPPDLLLIPLCLGSPKKAWRFAFLCSVGGILGAVVGYLIGWGFWEVAKDFFIPHVFSQASFDRVKTLYESWSFWIVLVAACGPLPYKVFTITAGVCGIQFVPFLLASIVGRPIRFYLVAALIHYFGEPIARTVDKYFNLISIAFAVLIVLGFVALKFWL